MAIKSGSKFDSFEVPKNAFTKISIDKFVALRDILNLPNSSNESVASVLTFQDSKYLSKTLLDKLKKEKIKITSTMITLQIEKQGKVSPVPKTNTKVSPAQTQIVLLSGFRDVNLEHRATLKGWIVKTNFSKAITLVVVKNFTKETEKTRKARENGITIISKEDFSRLV